MELGRFTRPPDAKSAKGRAVVFQFDDVVDSLVSLEPDVVDLPDLLLDPFRPFQHIQAQGLRATQGRKHIEVLDQIGATDEILAARQFSTVPEEILGDPPPGIVGIESQGRELFRLGLGFHAGMKPDGVRRKAGRGAEQQGERTGTEVNVGAGQHVQGKNRARQVVVIFRRPKRGVAVALLPSRGNDGRGHGFMHGVTDLLRPPQAEYHAFSVPPIDKPPFRFAPVRLPHRGILFPNLRHQVSSPQD